ncbi:MAG: alpha-amylase family glycosyl hydrolase [Verrucomicrobiota bacterium]
MSHSLHPPLLQANTRVWLTRLSRTLGKPATLDDIPDAELDRLSADGFEWVWMLGVWKTGATGRAISRANPEWRREFELTLPDLTEEDIGGSCFAIQDYSVAKSLGGPSALKRFRQRLAKRGLQLMLDFVPNHMALDHPWVMAHPDYFVAGGDRELALAPRNYFRAGGGQILAHGRDPYFPGWPDTVQLDYGNPAVQEAMTGELLAIAKQCDGVRCDMAMLLLPEVFHRTWGREARDFWPEAITRVRNAVSGFTFLAEVYWDLEWTLQQKGFDYCYDKRLYDRLRDGPATPVRDHLRAGLDYQEHLARFLENHDEPRAASVFSHERHGAAAVLTYFTPGLRFFHQGQSTGARVRISPHLVRGPEELVDEALQSFYSRLLQVLKKPVFREGSWRLLETATAWEGNPTASDFIAFAWTGPEGERALVAVNFSDHPAQCYVRLPWPDLAGKQHRLQDLLSAAVYDRDGHDLESRGLYLDVPEWHAHVFEVSDTGTVNDVPVA